MHLLDEANANLAVHNRTLSIILDKDTGVKFIFQDDFKIWEWNTASKQMITYTLNKYK